MAARRKARALPWAFLSYALIKDPEVAPGCYLVVAKEAGRRVKQKFNNRGEAREFARELHAAGVRDIEIRHC